MPPLLESLIIEAKNGVRTTRQGIETYSVLPIARAPWLARLPDTVHTLRVYLYLNLKTEAGQQMLKWPLKLKHLSVGLHLCKASQIEPCEGPLPTSPEPNRSDPDTPTSNKEEFSLKLDPSPAEHAKAMRVLQKGQKTTPSSMTPPESPKDDQTMAISHFLRLPSGTESLEIWGHPTPESPKSLPPALRSLHVWNDSSISMTKYLSYRQAHKTMIDCVWMNSEENIVSPLISSLQFLQALPQGAQSATVVLGALQGCVKLSEWKDFYPKDLTELHLSYQPYLRSDDEGGPRAPTPANISNMPSKLRKLRLYLGDPITILLPDTLTSVDVLELYGRPYGRLRTAVAMPRSLTHFSTLYHASADLTVFPSCLTSLKLRVPCEKISSASFSSRHLPVVMRHLAIETDEATSRTSTLITWWASIPKDIRLETFSLCTDKPTPLPQPTKSTLPDSAVPVHSRGHQSAQTAERLYAHRHGYQDPPMRGCAR